jgi:predicted enzyme related to lactoylglutathione lyase
MANPVTWFEVIGPDAAALHKFYKDVFAWKLTPPVKEMGNYSMLMGHEPGIGGGVGEGERRVSVYIESAEPQRLLDKALAAGATLIMPVTTVTPDTTIAMFTDPGGNTIGILKANPRAGAASTAPSSRTARPRAKAASSRPKKKTATRGRKTAAKKTATKRKATKRAKRR